MANMSAKFDQEANNSLVAIVFTSWFPYIICPLWPWPLTSKINRVHPLTMVNMSAKFDKEIRFSLHCVHKLISIYVHCDPWPLTYKINSLNRVYPLTMANTSAKFDQEAHDSLVAIVFTSLFPFMSIVTLTFDLWPPKSIGFILSSWLTCLPSLSNKHATV